jgi:hypothetical protein
MTQRLPWRPVVSTAERIQSKYIGAIEIKGDKAILGLYALYSTVRRYECIPKGGPGVVSQLYGIVITRFLRKKATV